MIEDELTRELARHFTDDHEPQTVAQALEGLARACWTRAGEMPDHLHDETAANNLIRRALAAAARSAPEFEQAPWVFAAGRFTVPNAFKNPEHIRLLITYRLMADCLWDTCVSGSYPYLSRISADLVDDRSTHSPAARTEAPMVNVPNWMKTADAIHNGLVALKESGELTYLPDRDAIRKALKRP